MLVIIQAPKAHKNGHLGSFQELRIVMLRSCGVQVQPKRSPVKEYGSIAQKSPGHGGKDNKANIEILRAGIDGPWVFS